MYKLTFESIIKIVTMVTNQYSHNPIYTLIVIKNIYGRSIHLIVFAVFIIIFNMLPFFFNVAKLNQMLILLDIIT